MSRERNKPASGRRQFPLTAYLLPLTVGIVACAVTPLSRRILVGEEPFVIGVGEGSDSMTDLFAAPAGGGAFIRLTFTRAEERLPRLSPEGTSVVFVRREGGDRPRWALVVLDLRTTVEHSAPLPSGAGDPVRTGWARNGSAVVFAGGYFALAPELDSLTPVSPSEQPAADSATRELLGDPPAAMVGECSAGELCITAANGDTTRLGAGDTGAIRWGADSLGYFTTRGFEVRPLSTGASRRPDWSGKPSALRRLTHHPGRTAR